MPAVDDAFFQLVRTHAIDTFHQNISEHCGITYPGDKRKGELKARITFQFAQVKRNYRNLLHPRFGKRTTDKRDVVGSTASAAGLCDDDRDFVQVIIAGKQRIHDLADDDQRRIACIVIHILQSDIDRILIVVGQHFQMIPSGVERSLQKRKVHRRHLRAEDSVILLHLFGKDHTIHGSRLDDSFFFLLFLCPECCQKGTNTDAGSTEIVDFIDLQACVDLAAVLQNLIDLVRRDRIQAAAERIQLDQIQIIPRFHIVGGSVKP